MAEETKKLASKETVGVTLMLVLITAAIFLAVGYWAGINSVGESAAIAVPPVPPTPSATATASTAL